MSEKKCGPFTIEVWEGGHPAWVHIRDERGFALAGFHHKDLADLAYLLEWARHEARKHLGEQYKDEVR